MSTQSLLIVGGVAVVALGVGVFLSGRDKGSNASDTKALVPVLEQRLNDVAAVRIEGGDAPFTLKQDGSHWTIAEKSGYPGDAAKLRQLLLELGRARKLEQKTASPAGFEQLGVQEPDAEGSDSRAVVLLDAKGEEITRVIVGKRRFGKGSTQGPIRADEESYVRVAGDANAWLAAGKLTFDTSPIRWLDQTLFDVTRDRLAAAEFKRAEGEPLVVARGTKDEQELKPVTLPEGRTTKTPSGAAQVLNGLAGLRFDDVASATGVEWPETPDVTSTFWTFDGLKVTAQTVDKDGKTWARFKAEVVDKTTRPGVPPESEVVGPPPLLANPALDVAAEGDELGSDEAADAKPVGPTPEELAAEAKKINDKVGGWVFVVPSWKANAFKLKLDDVLAPLPEPPTVSEPPDDGLQPEGGLQPDDAPGAEGPVEEAGEAATTTTTTTEDPGAGGAPPPTSTGGG